MGLCEGCDASPHAIQVTIFSKFSKWSHYIKQKWPVLTSNCHMQLFCYWHEASRMTDIGKMEDWGFMDNHAHEVSALFWLTSTPSRTSNSEILGEQLLLLLNCFPKLYFPLTFWSMWLLAECVHWYKTKKSDGYFWYRMIST